MATILGDSGVIGSIGADFAAFNRHLFGYISFVYLFVLGIGLYALYRRGSFDARCTEVTVAYILLFFSLQIFQAIVGSGELRGMFGANFVDFTVEYIGYFGVWVFFLMALVLSLVMILDKSVSEMAQPLRDVNFRLPIPSLPLLPRRVKAEEEAVEESPVRARKAKAYKRVEKSTEEAMPDDDLDAPAYLRHANEEEEPAIRLIKRSEETEAEEDAEVVEDDIMAGAAERLGGGAGDGVIEAARIRVAQND